MLRKMLCKLLGHRWSGYVKGKKSTVFEVRVCQRCSKQQRRRLSPPVIEEHAHHVAPQNNAPSVPVAASNSLTAPTTLGNLPGCCSAPDDEFIRRGREQWGPINKPWEEVKP
jgi:hypothetical protein